MLEYIYLDIQTQLIYFSNKTSSNLFYIEDIWLN